MSVPLQSVWIELMVSVLSLFVITNADADTWYKMISSVLSRIIGIEIKSFSSSTRLSNNNNIIHDTKQNNNTTGSGLDDQNGISMRLKHRKSWSLTVAYLSHKCYQSECTRQANHSDDEAHVDTRIDETDPTMTVWKVRSSSSLSVITSRESYKDGVW